MFHLCCWTNQIWATVITIVILTFYKFIKELRKKQLKKVYFKDKCVLITGASKGLGKGAYFV